MGLWGTRGRLTLTSIETQQRRVLPRRELDARGDAVGEVVVIGTLCCVALRCVDLMTQQHRSLARPTTSHPTAASNEHRLRALGVVCSKELPEENDSLHVLEIVAQ